MWKAPVFILLAFAAILLQVSFFSQLFFPFSAFSFPLVGIAYGVLRERQVSSAGWALLGGFLLDLHGILSFGAELTALFVAFFAVRFLFRRVVTNTGTGALFLLGASTALAHWLVLLALDGAQILFGAVPVILDWSAAALLAPLRQALVAGIALCALAGLENLVRSRFRKAFLSYHVPQTFS